MRPLVHCHLALLKSCFDKLELWPADRDARGRDWHAEDFAARGGEAGATLDDSYCPLALAGVMMVALAYCGRGGRWRSR